MHDLTDVERRVYSILQEHFARGDDRITVREISVLLGHRTTSRAQETMNSLTRRGYIIKSPRNGRVIGLAHKCPTCGQAYPEKAKGGQNAGLS
jgi:predicted transcriptional regulator